MPSVDDLLRATLLGKKLTFSSNSLDNKLRVSNQASTILNSTIQFMPAKRPYESESKALKSKYSRLRAPPAFGSISFNGRVQPCSSTPSSSSFTLSLESNTSVKVVSSKNGGNIPPPMFDIFPADKIRLHWDANLKRSTAVGLHNLGNTCFLNSVLQVLTNTAPLVNHLLSGEHDGGKCPSATGFCALCLMKNHVQRVFQSCSGGAISPSSIVSRVRCFMKSHCQGRQEDAHEFLRYFVDAMQTAALHQFKGKKLDLFTKETSVIGRIFGGYHKNEVICNNCQFDSTTYDPFLDLSVEVKHANSLEAALSHFTRAETLANENAYKCPKCKRKVSAKKIFTIHQAPNVLTIQLKRFDHFGKIDRFISYPERLSLRPYMTEKQGPPVNYKLYGVIVHYGRSTRSGHYYAFARNPCDQWHLLDDSRAAAVSPNNALKSAGAYLLFYVRTPTPVAAVKPQAQTPPAARSIPVQAIGKPLLNNRLGGSPPLPNSKPILTQTHLPFTPVPRPAPAAAVLVKPVESTAPEMKTSPIKPCVVVISPIKVKEPNLDNHEGVKKSKLEIPGLKKGLDLLKKKRQKRLEEKKMKREKKKLKRKKKHEKIEANEDANEHLNGVEEDGSDTMEYSSKKSCVNDHAIADEKTEATNDVVDDGSSGKKKRKKKKKKKRQKALEVPLESSSMIDELSEIQEIVEEPKKHKRKKAGGNEERKAKKHKHHESLVVVNGDVNGKEKKRDVVQQLGSQSRLGYGVSVKSWSGTANSVDNLVVEDDDEITDMVADDWNEELDKGKVKKRKKTRGQFMCLGMNPFQTVQNLNNRREKARKMKL